MSPVTERPTAAVTPADELAQDIARLDERLRWLAAWISTAPTHLGPAAMA